MDATRSYMITLEADREALLPIILTLSDAPIMIVHWLLVAFAQIQYETTWLMHVVMVSNKILV